MDCMLIASIQDVKKLKDALQQAGIIHYTFFHNCDSLQTEKDFLSSSLSEYLENTGYSDNISD